MGNAGAEWKVFLADKEGHFIPFEEMFFHPWAISIRPIKKGVSKIITYHHLSARDGTIAEEILSSKGIEAISCGKLIRPGSDEIVDDHELYGKLFSYMHGDEHCKLTDYLKNKSCWKKEY